jgi:hypothetical protein
MLNAEMPHTRIRIIMRSNVCSSMLMVHCKAHSYSDEEMMHSGERRRLRAISSRYSEEVAKEQSEQSSYICYLF